MWHKPNWMLALSEIILVIAGVVLALSLLVLGARSSWFPLKAVVFVHPLSEVSAEDIEQTLESKLLGNFFNVDLDALRAALEAMPWVRRAEIRRVWPGKLEIVLEEHVALAHWDSEQSGEWINTQGERFLVTGVRTAHTPLPLFKGPDIAQEEMFVFYQEAAPLLAGIERRIIGLTVSPRFSMRLYLEDGTAVELGRKDQKLPHLLQVARFIRYYPSLFATGRGRPTLVDMRYPSGFALGFVASP